MHFSTGVFCCFAFFVAACSSEPPSGSSTQGVLVGPARTAITELTPEGFLPVGTRVAAGQDIAAPPEPFDPRRQVAIPNTQPEKNVVGNPGFPKRMRRWFEGSDVAPSSRVAKFVTGDLSAYIGFYQTSKTWYGVYSVNDVRLDIDLSVGGATSAQMFAPTIMAPGGACLEMTTWHTLQYGIPGTSHFQGWTDWCGSSPGLIGYAESLSDPTFQSKYVRTYLGQPTVSLVIVTPNTGHTNGQCWYGHLYNYNLGGWEQKATSCGFTANVSGVLGWAAWEAYGFDPGLNCPVTPSIRATSLQFADPSTSTWIPVTQYPIDVTGPSYSGTCFPGTYKFRYPGTTVGLPANAWLARTDILR
jgi:hypothetical protein